MKKHNVDLDNLIKEQEERERINAMRSGGSNEPAQQKVLVGTVEKYFTKLGVAAIKLSNSLAINDIIEIGDEEESIRQRVKSMQINRVDVEEADSGDSVGVLVKCPVPEGASVYKIK